MSSLLRCGKNGKRLGPVQVVSREDYGGMAVDAKVELIRNLIPVALLPSWGSKSPARPRGTSISSLPYGLARCSARQRDGRREKARKQKRSQNHSHEHHPHVAGLRSPLFRLVSSALRGVNRVQLKHDHDPGFQPTLSNLFRRARQLTDLRVLPAPETAR
jgi:hypothetical protein